MEVNYIAAIKRDCRELKNIPSEDLKAKYYLIAYEFDNEAIHYFPRRNSELAVKIYSEKFFKKMLYYCQDIVSYIHLGEYYSEFINFDNIPYFPDSKKILADAIEEDPELLAIVPEQLITKELCLLAIKHSSFTIAYVPDSIYSDEFVTEAMIANHRILRFIDSALITKQMYLKAIELNAKVLKFVPKELRTKRFLARAIKANNNAIKYMHHYRNLQLTYE